MDNTKKVCRWLSQIQHCHDQAKGIIAQIGQGQHSASLLAHCQERLEFLASREKVLTSRMRRLHRLLTEGVADASKNLLDTILDAVKQHGQVVLTRTESGGLRIDIPPAEKTKSS